MTLISASVLTGSSPVFSIFPFLALIRMLSLDLGPTLTQLDLISTLTLITTAKTLFPSKVTVLRLHMKFWENTIQPTIANNWKQIIWNETGSTCFIFLEYPLAGSSVEVLLLR